LRGAERFGGRRGGFVWHGLIVPSDARPERRRPPFRPWPVVVGTPLRGRCVIFVGAHPVGDGRGTRPENHRPQGGLLQKIFPLHAVQL
jgi:hypothetical protein